MHNHFKVTREYKKYKEEKKSSVVLPTEAMTTKVLQSSHLVSFCAYYLNMAGCIPFTSFDFGFVFA